MNQEIVLISIPKSELETLIIDSVNACLKYHKTELRPMRQSDNTDDHAEFVTKKEAARILSCSVSTVDGYRRAGRLTPHYLGAKKASSVRFKRMEVLQLLEGKNQ